MEEKIKDFETLLNKNIEFWKKAHEKALKDDLELHEQFCKGCVSNAKAIKEVLETIFNKG